MKSDAPSFHQKPASNLNPLARPTDSTQPIVYQIRIEGQLDCAWADWFDGMTIAPQANGDTVLTGAVIDQAALYGLLKKFRDLGMALVSVNRVNPHVPDASEVNKNNRVPVEERRPEK